MTLFVHGFIPITPHDGIMPFVILLAVQLVHRHLLGLLPAMVCRIQGGLRMLTEQFCRKVTTTRAGKELVFPRDGPSSWVKMLYAYLMAWFALHCPVLIQPREKHQKTNALPTFTASRVPNGWAILDRGQKVGRMTRLIQSLLMFSPHPRHSIW